MASVVGTCEEVKEVAEEVRAEMTHDLETNKTVESWAKESFAVAVRYGYLDGKVLPANTEDDPDKEDIPRVADKYATDAGRAARLAMFKAGKRLADTVKQTVN